MIQKRILFIATIVVALLTAFILYQILIFRVVGTTPGLKNVSVISPFIDVNFNKAVSKDSIDLSSNTTAIAGFEVFEKKTVRIFFENLELDTSNTVVINSIENTSGDKLTNLQFSFIAKDIPFKDMPKVQQKAILDRQDKPNQKRDDPILAHLPHGTLNFKLSATVKEDNLVLEAQLLLSAADARIDANAAAEQYKKEVQNYIRSVGLNPEDYHIEYQVVQPVL